MKLQGTLRFEIVKFVFSYLMVGIAGFNTPALAQNKLTLGIATSVGDTVGLIDVRENFAALSTAISTGLKASVAVSAVSPTLLQGAFEQNGFDIMLVLTSDAWKAQNQNAWKILALSEDREGNVVTLMSRSGIKINNLSDLKGKKIGSSGTFTRDVLNALLKQNGISPQAVEMRDARDPEALVYFINNSFSDVVALRDPALIKQLTAIGAEAFFKTDPIPVYAVIVNPKISLEQLDKIKQVIITFQLPAVFSQRTKIKAFKPLSSEHSLALSLFD